MIRVLVADDSPTVRVLLKSILESDPQIEVIAEAENGTQAVNLTVSLRPDLVTMDVHMPELDGVDASAQIMDRVPTPIVVVTASSLESGVSRAFDALDAGAVALLEKPMDPSDAGFSRMSEDLLRTVRGLADLRLVRRRETRPTRVPAPPPERRPIVGIAASTGGPSALDRIFRSLPPDFPLPVLVVQHIAPGFTEGMVSWLDERSALPVSLGAAGVQIEPGRIYVAPDHHHMSVGARARLELSDAPKISGHRPSATHMFRSLARTAGREAIAVALTGMGTDGVDGLAEVKLAGGQVLAQDEATSVVYGMNGETVRAGLAQEVLPLEEIPLRLAELSSLAPRRRNAS